MCDVGMTSSKSTGLFPFLLSCTDIFHTIPSGLIDLWMESEECSTSSQFHAWLDLKSRIDTVTLGCERCFVDSLAYRIYWFIADDISMWEHPGKSDIF